MNPETARASLALKIILWLTICFTVLGHFFKTMHWPGASAMLVVSTFLFVLFYLPLFVIEGWKSKSTGKGKLIFTIESFFIFLFSLGFLFKLMHWPSAGIFYFINTYLLLFVLLPYALYHLARSKSLAQTHNLVLILYFFTGFSGALLNSGSGKINIDTVLQSGINSEGAFKSAASRNKQLYSTLAKLHLAPNSPIIQKSSRLRSLSDSATENIRQLKSYLLVNTDKIPKEKADTLSSLYIENKINYDISTAILFGDELNPKKGKFSGAWLNGKISNYRDSILVLAEEQNRAIIAEGLNLSTENYTNENGEPVTWEMTNFYNLPIVHVINTLTNIQYEVKNAEYQVLTDIINAGNKDLNSALINKVSELSAKFESEQKEQKIAALENENKKGMELLLEKDYSIRSSNKAIVFFVMILVVFVILVFFVIRSNILRRKTNKTLQKQNEIIEAQKSEVELQKDLVEEKQKELLDSIYYAKRIQVALISNEYYIENALKRLNGKR
jgi:hypothetical protein